MLFISIARGGLVIEFLLTGRIWRVAEVLSIVELIFVASELNLAPFTLYIITVYWLLLNFMVRIHILVLELVVASSLNLAASSQDLVVSELFSPSFSLFIIFGSSWFPFIIVVIFVAVAIVIIFIVISVSVSTSLSFCYVLPEPFRHGWLSTMPPVALVLQFFKFPLALLHHFGPLPFSFLLGLLLLTLSLRFLLLVPLPPIAFHLYKCSLWHSFYDLESIKYEGLRVVGIIVTTIIFS